MGKCEEEVFWKVLWTTSWTCELGGCPNDCVYAYAMESGERIFFTCLEESVGEETESNSCGGSCLLHHLPVSVMHLSWQACTLKINPIHYLLKLLHRSFTLFSWKNKVLYTVRKNTIVPKATDILVSVRFHTHIEELRINPPQLQKERERNEFCIRSIWSVCLLSDLVSPDHRWYLTSPLHVMAMRWWQQHSQV